MSRNSQSVVVGCSALVLLEAGSLLISSSPNRSVRTATPAPESTREILPSVKDLKSREDVQFFPGGGNRYDTLDEYRAEFQRIKAAPKATQHEDSR